MTEEERVLLRRFLHEALNLLDDARADVYGNEAPDSFYLPSIDAVRDLLR